MRARTGPQKHNARQRDGFHAVKILLGRRKSIEPAAISRSWTLKDASHNRSFSRSSDEQPGLCERGVVMWRLNFLGEHNLSMRFRLRRFAFFYTARLCVQMNPATRSILRGISFFTRKERRSRASNSSRA